MWSLIKSIHIDVSDGKSYKKNKFESSSLNSRFEILCVSALLQTRARAHTHTHTHAHTVTTLKTIQIIKITSL